MKIENHRLVTTTGTPGAQRIRYIPSPNHGGVMVPKYLVIHFTAGADMDITREIDFSQDKERSINRGIEWYLEDLQPNSRDVIGWFQSAAAKVSAHIVMAEDGRVIQMVDFNKVAWHAGKSQWKGLVGLNQHSIGIEICNWGRLRRREDGEFITYTGVIIPANRVVKLRHKNEDHESYWHTYTDAQIKAIYALSEALFATYGLAGVIGHDDIAPGRKNDPGPAFPMQHLQAKMEGRQEETLDGEVYEVTAEVLNIRSEPNITAIKVGRLKRGDKLTVRETRGDWSKVEFEGEPAWAASRYLKAA